MTTSQSVESFTGCFPTSNMRSRLPTAHSVADALEAIEQKSFDIYVLDYKSYLGYDLSAVALRAEKLGISAFLEKPFSRETICNAVKKAIGSPKAASKLSQADSPVSTVATKPTKSRFWRR